MVMQSHQASDLALQEVGGLFSLGEACQLMTCLQAPCLRLLLGTISLLGTWTMSERCWVLQHQGTVLIERWEMEHVFVEPDLNTLTEPEHALHY